MAEQPPCKRRVKGPIPFIGSVDGWQVRLVEGHLTCEPATVRAGSYPSGQRGLTVNQMANAFGGSNPSLPTLVDGPEMRARQALIAQLVEHALGKGGVMGSTPIEGSKPN